MDERSRGHIEIITGGMFSGKSEELVRRLRRAAIARQRVQVFKPRADTRHDEERLVTRDKRALSAIPVSDSGELRERLELGVHVVGIDEGQFFDAGLAELAVEMADRGVRVIVAGLDLDYLRRPFGPMPVLLAVAEYVDKMHAICVRCGSPAQFSQRIAGGGEQLQVGDEEAYEARCRRCYVPFVPGDGRNDEGALARDGGDVPGAGEGDVGEDDVGGDDAGERPGVGSLDVVSRS